MVSLLWIVVALSIQVCLAQSECSTADNSKLSMDQTVEQYLGKSDFHTAFLKVITTDQSLESYRAAIDSASTAASNAHNTAAWERSILLASLYDNQLPNNFCAYYQLVQTALDFAKNNDQKDLACSVELTFAIISEILKRVNRVALRTYGCTVSSDVPVMREPSCYVKTCSSDYADKFKEYQTIIAQAAKESTGVDDIYGPVLENLLTSDDPKLKFVVGSSLLVGANEVWIAKQNLTAHGAVGYVSVTMVKYMQKIAFHKDCDCITAARILREMAESFSYAVYEEGLTVLEAYAG